MRKATKTIISFAVILIAGLNFIVPAFAQDPFTSIAIGGIGGASGAGLFSSMAGMSGIDIGWSQTGSDPLDAMWNVLNPDHVYFSGDKHEATGIDEDVWDYITVDLHDWLEAQSDFIINFAQTNNIEDNDTGTVNLPANYEGLPLNTYMGQVEMPAIGGDNKVTIGNLIFEAERTSNNRYLYVSCHGRRFGKSVGVDTGQSAQFKLFSYNGKLRVEAYNMSGQYLNRWDYTDQDVSNSQSVPWTSTTVNTQVFNGWENAKVKIPHTISGLTTGWTVPDFTNALNDLWDQGLQGQIVIEDTDKPVPPPPVPSTPLGDVPFDDWIDLWGQGIYQQLENQSDALDLIGSNGEDQIEELESIDSNLDDLNQTAESIDTNIGIGNGILGGIRSLAQSAVNFLEGIAEHVGELVEEIVEGTETLIAGILNQIPQAFGVIFGPIKQASSIWHYVVEWIQSIGAPFQFIWSMASGTSYYIILPVYASLAAAVVLAFYKRFGK